MGYALLAACRFLICPVLYYVSVEAVPVHTPRLTILPGGTVIITLQTDVLPAYRGGWESSAWFFAPIHALDKQIRPDVWGQ